MTEKVTSLIASIDSLLEKPIFCEKTDNPIVKIAKITLIRELMWAEQLATALRDEADWDTEYQNLMRHSEISQTCLFGIQGMI